MSDGREDPRAPMPRAGRTFTEEPSSDPVSPRAPDRLPPIRVLTESELRISARLLLHIARQPRYGPMESVPLELTQEGMAQAMRVSQGAVSSALGRLVDGGVLEVRLGHVRGRWRRLKAYHLTPKGEQIVRHIQASMGILSVVVTIPFSA